MQQFAREELTAAEPVRRHATATLQPKRRPGPPPAVAFGGNAAIHRLVSGGGNPAVLSGGGGRALSRLVHGAPQAKLTVSRPSDPMEREADAVAARVTAGPGTWAPVHAQPTVARAPAEAGEQISAVPASVEWLIRDPGAGEPLPPDVRERIESHLGVALGGVQVHGEPAARDAAAQLNARAFTFGGHIFLGPGESASDLALMAHEATHVVQQGAVNVYRDMLHRSSDSILPDFIVDAARSYARNLPGYDMLTVVAGYDPIDDRTVERTPQNLVRGVIGLVPFGNAIADRLIQLEIVQDAFTLVDQGLTANNLTMARIRGDIDKAWDELSLTNGIDGNAAILARYVDALYQDAMRFARSLVDTVIQMIRDAAVGLAETYLADSPAWALAKKVIHYDPLRGTPVAATTVEILTDLLTLIGKQDKLAQMQERGTLQKTADWIDTQIGRFMSLIGELGALFEAGWAAIQPANIANLPENLEKLARDAVGLVQRVVAFGADLLVAALRLIKESLLGWLSGEAHKMRGFRLLTVILGENPFTHEAVPRNATNLIGGFIALLPNGEATYAQLAESGVIAEAGGRIEAAMTRLGISLDMITNTFLGVWNSLSLEDLLNPIGAFVRVLEKFGEPLGRIVEFVTEVMKVVIELILKLMNFPSDLLGSIISNAMQAIDDIQRDPVGFLVNMLEALKAGLSGFFDHVLGYLLDGLAAWLFRGLGALGISKPPDYSLKSILDLVLQVLGVTAEKLWQKLGEQIGPENVAKIRGAIDTLSGVWTFIKDVQEGGVAAIWKHVESQLGNLWDTLLSMAKDWIVTEIVEKVTAKLLSMLDPTGIMAVVNSMIAFFKAIQSAIEYLRDILQIVNEYVTTLAAVAAGSIAPGAAKIERGLANAIPVAIGFLANQVGLGNVPEKVVEIIQGLRQLVDEALTWLFEQAMRLGKAALDFLMGKPDDSKPADGQGATGEPIVIKEEFGEGAKHHTLTSQANTQELILRSDPIPVSTIPDPTIQRLYRQYVAKVTAYDNFRASAAGRPDAADQIRAMRDEINGIIREIVAQVKELGIGGAPLADAPGLGEVRPYKEQTSRLSNAGFWRLEAEHVVPNGYFNAILDGMGLDRIERSQEYQAMATVLIYEGAAQLKTQGPKGPDEGDTSVIGTLKAWAAERIRKVREAEGPSGPDHSPMRDWEVEYRRFRAEFLRRTEVVNDRTVEKMRIEQKQNGERRGHPPGDDSLINTLAPNVADAKGQQLELFNQAFEERVHDKVDELEASGRG